MKIALAYHQFISRGGMEGYLLRFARELLARGHEVHVLTAQRDAATAVLPVRCHLAPAAAGRSQRAFSDWAAQAAPRAGAEVVLGFGRTVAQDIHRAGGGCHARYSRLLPWYKRLRPKNAQELALERELYTGGRTRHFVANAAPVARQLMEEFGVPAERFSVIHTPVDAEAFRPAERKPARAEGGAVFLFAGSHYGRKGLAAALEALALVPEARLRVAGPPPSLRWRLAARATGRVEWLGHRSDMAEVMRGADFFLHPTRYDACANTVLQAMASGLPALVSLQDGAHEFIADGRTGWLLAEPENAPAIAAVMRRALATSPTERHSIAAAARARMLPLTWQAHVDAWLALAGRLAEQR